MPMNLLLLLLVLSTFLIILKKYQHAIISGCVTTLFFLIISTPLLPGALINHLEQRYKVFTDFDKFREKQSVNIIVLGGGHTPDPVLPPNAQLSQNALGRLVEGIRICNALPNSQLILSGYSESGHVTQAEELNQTARLLGVDPRKLILQKEPATTCQEAQVYANHFDPGIPLIVVTSASHMPRAMFAFNKIGVVNATAAPTNFMIKHDPYQPDHIWLPETGNIRMLELAMHEYAGLWWYKIRVCK